MRLKNFLLKNKSIIVFLLLIGVSCLTVVFLFDRMINGKMFSSPYAVDLDALDCPSSPIDETAGSTVIDNLVKNTSKNENNAEFVITMSNFTLDVPTGGSVTGVDMNGEARESIISVITPSLTSRRHSDLAYIFSDVSSLPEGKVQAHSLEDFKRDYMVTEPEHREVYTEKGVVSLYSPYELVIHSQCEQIVNGIPMLLQQHSYGYKSVNENGNEIFYTSEEYGFNHIYRYVFYDGAIFVIMKSDSLPLLELLAHSIKLKQTR